MSKKNKNEKVAASQLAPSELVDKSDMPPAEREPRDMREFLGLAAEIAQDTTYVRNSRWEGSREDFPHEPTLRTCDKYFKDAEGGPLYIDEPVTKADLANCKRKAEALRARGLRYVYIDRGPRGIDPDIEDVMAQLEDTRGVA